jgi:hypothetical protein
MLAPVKPIGLQVYVLAPVAVRVALLPTQIEGDVEVSVRFGVGLTTTVKMVELTQPNELVPLNVYELVLGGVTV